MKSFRAWYLAVALSGSLALVAGARPLELLTPAEAAQPNLPATNRSGPITGSQSLQPGGRRGAAPGAPQIVVEMPAEGVLVSTPFPVKIHFLPAPGAKINLESLKVEVLKLVPISLLSRVKPYLTATGIDVPEAKIPAGTYNVHIAVSDDQGRETSTVQTWMVH